MWYYSENGNRRGPFTNREIRRRVREGVVTPDDFVWTEELNQWTPAGDVPELFPEAPEEPPPASQGVGDGHWADADHGIGVEEAPTSESDSEPDSASDSASEASPSSHVNKPQYEPNPDLLSPRGRIGRLKYLMYNIVIFVLMIGALASVFLPFGFLAAAVAVVGGGIVSVFLTIRRLHDMDLSGWFAVPIVGASLISMGVLVILIEAFLIFTPGTQGPNQYGPVPA